MKLLFIKKIILRSMFAFVALVPTTLWAQNDSLEVILSQDVSDTVKTEKKDSLPDNLHVAVVAGIGNANMYTSSDNQYIGKRPILHYYAGGLVDYAPFRNRNLFIESGVMFQQKGYQSENTGYEVVEESKLRMLCLNFPLLACYSLDVSGIYVVPQIGPYFSAVLMANKKGFRKFMSEEEGKSDIQKYDNDLFEEENAHGENKYRRFDCGLHFGISIVFLKHFRGGIGYDLGFMNFQREKYMDKKVKTNVGAFSVNFAYYFF